MANSIEDNSDEPGNAPAIEMKRADRFYSGRIRRIFRGSQSGLVESDTGREINFVFPHVVVTGAARRFDELREGMSVGFDVGWTSKGLIITVLKVDGPNQPMRPTQPELSRGPC